MIHPIRSIEPESLSTSNAGPEVGLKRTEPPQREPSLADLWQQSARRASDTSIAICAGQLPVGLVVASVVQMLRPQWVTKWWPLSAVPLLIGAFGLWAIADRENSSPGETGSRTGWRSLQAVAVALAAAAAAIVVLWFFRRAIGTWIS